MALFNMGSLFNDNELTNMITRVDDLVSSLDKNKAPDPNLKDSSSNAIKEFMEMAKENKDEHGNIEKLLENIGIPAQRSNRYRIYDEIHSSVQLLKSIVKVYISNILQKDIITGKTLVYLESPEFKTDNTIIQKYKTFSQHIINNFNIEKSLSDTVLQDILRYGDHYIEIVDLLNDVANLPRIDQVNSIHNSPTYGNTVGATNNDTKILTDSQELKFIEEQFAFIENRLKINGSVTEHEKLNKVENCIERLVECMCEFNDISIYDVDVNEHISKIDDLEELITESKVDIDSFDPTNINRIMLRFHNPKNMVVLTTSHSNVLGYVEIQENKAIEITPGVGMQFASIVKQISAVSKSKTEDHSSLIRRIIHQMVSKIVKKLDIPNYNDSDGNKNYKQLQREYEELIHQKIGDELFFTIKRLYFESEPQKMEKMPKINIRFIPNDRVVQLCLNPIEYAPYGTSILDNLIYPAKLYLLTQLTNIVMKLSRAATIRKWTVETGQ